LATDVRNRRPARKTGPRAAWKTGFYYTRGTPPRPAPRGPRRKKPPPGAADPRRATPGGRTPAADPWARRTPGAADPGRADPRRRTPGGRHRPWPRRRAPAGGPSPAQARPGPEGEGGSDLYKPFTGDRAPQSREFPTYSGGGVLARKAKSSCS